MQKLPKEFEKLGGIENDFKRRLYFTGILTKYLSLRAEKERIAKALEKIKDG